MLVLVRVAPAAQGKLVAPALGLLRYPPEVLHGHVGLVHDKAALVAADTSLGAEARLAVDAVAHNAHVDEMRIGRHKGVHAGVPPAFVQDPGPHIGAGLRIESGAEAVLFVMNNILQYTPPLLICLQAITNCYGRFFVLNCPFIT